jgi:hypothetical protein
MDYDDPEMVGRAVPDTETLPLFAPLERPSVPVDTSEDAAASVEGVAGKLRREVFDCIGHWIEGGWDGATCEEICDELSLEGNTVRPRLWELENGGYIVKSEQKRETHSGRPARVYVLTDKGKAHATRGGAA